MTAAATTTRTGRQARPAAPRRSTRARRAGAAASSGEGSSPASAAVGVLREYADRGVFGGFSHEVGSRGKQRVRFRWLAGSSFDVHLDPRGRRLTFAALLPNVPPRSAMDRALRAFLRERSSAALPAHRRVDPRRLRVRCANRGGSVSVTLALRRRGAAREREDWSYAARRGVSLVNEIFHGFLRGPYHEYMVRSFGEQEE
jgi:hypothetical protein